MTWVDDAPESDIKQSHISVSMCQLLPWLWGCWREEDVDHHWSCLCFWENCLTFRKGKKYCKCKHNLTGDTFDSSRATPLTSTRYKTLAELLPASKSNLLEMSIGVLPWDTGDYLNPWEKKKVIPVSDLYFTRFFLLLSTFDKNCFKKKSSTSSSLRERRWSTSSCQGLLLSSSHLRWCWKAAATFCQKNGALRAEVGSKLPLFRLALSEILSQIAAIIPPFRDRGAAVEKSGIPHFIKKNPQNCARFGLKSLTSSNITETLGFTTYN